MPDFNMTPNAFPIASVIDAAQRNAQLQQQAREQGNQSIVQGMQAIANVGNSLYDQRVKMAQALAGAHMYAQEHPELVNPTQTTTQAPVMRNQTAAYDPSTGSVTPNTDMTGVGTTTPQTTTTPPPLDIKTLATASYGMAPKDLFQNMIQNRLAKTQQGELALKQQTEPQKIAIEGRKATAEEQNNAILRNIQLMTASNAITHTANEHEDTLRTRRDSLIKDLSALPDWMHPASAAAQKEIDNIDSILSKKNPGAATPGTPIKTGKGTTYTVNP